MPGGEVEREEGVLARCPPPIEIFAPPRAADADARHGPPASEVEGERYWWRLGSSRSLLIRAGDE